MLGLRWDVTSNFMLRAEYQWSNGTWTLPRRENPVPGDTEKNWEMFSLLGSYRF
jgi:opacity protein-like surface antigen